MTGPAEQQTPASVVEQLRNEARKLRSQKERGPAFHAPWGQDIIDADNAKADLFTEAADLIEALSARTPPAMSAEELAKIISDEEIIRVHANANFGAMPPRDVVNDGVRKVAVGYHCGHTQFTILRNHGLITKPRAMSYDCNLTKKGKRYFRALIQTERVG